MPDPATALAEDQIFLTNARCFYRQSISARINFWRPSAQNGAAYRVISRLNPNPRFKIPQNAGD